MNLIKLTILWLSAGECLAKIFQVTSKTSEPGSLVEATVRILSCYGNEIRTVGLAGAADSVLYEELCSEQFLPVVLIGNDRTDATVDRKSRHKVQIFIVKASSSTELEHTLGQVKRSRWWNHMATFLIVDWSSGPDHGCSNAFPYLWTAWKKNLLNALYACQHPTKGRLVYSFNPYTSQAPDPWQWEKTFRGKNEHPWTLLRREYVGDERICFNLEFHKTSDLGGYKIYSSVKEHESEWIVDDNKTGLNRLGGTESILIKAIFQALNAIPHLVVHDGKIPGLNDRLGNDMAMDTVNDISDVLLQHRALPIVWNYTTSGVFSESGLTIVTQFSGDQSQLNKLLSVLDRSTRFGLCLVMVITVFFFKYFLGQHIGSAILNVIRISTNSSLTRVPSNQAARFYLAGVFFLVVTIVGIYQGKLASLLTKPKAMPNVDKMQDLAERGYTIHGHKTYAYLFTDPMFEGLFIEHQNYDCEKDVVRDPSAACVRAIHVLIDVAAELKLHVSREPITKTPCIFVIRDDWPLEERFNSVLVALSESHVIQRLMMGKASQTMSIAKFYEDERKKEKFKVIVLEDLTFAFSILEIGLGCAAVCFVVEIVVWQLRQKKRN